MPLTPDNKQLLLDIAKNYAVVMGHWIVESDCGTIGCIAGSVCLARGWKLVKARENEICEVTKDGIFGVVWDVALMELGLTDPDTWIFYIDSWPDDLQLLYMEKPRAALKKAVTLFIKEMG